MAIAKKKKPADRAGINVNVIVSEEVHAALDKAVEKHDESLSVVVRKYIRNGLAADGLL